MDTSTVDVLSIYEPLTGTANESSLNLSCLARTSGISSLSNPRFHHSNSSPIHALALYRPPDLSHLRLRASRHSPTERYAHTFHSTSAVRFRNVEKPKPSHTVVQILGLLVDFVDIPFEIPHISEWDPKHPTARRLVGSPLPSSRTASETELAVRDSYRRPGGPEQSPAVHFVQGGRQGREQSQEMCRACRTQIDQIADLGHDGVYIFLEAHPPGLSWLSG
jgi:hypothetical protein